MLKQTKIKVGTRGSPLALAQLKEVQALLSSKGVDLAFDPVVYQTSGDRDKKTPLAAEVADDFFTDAIDCAVLNGDVEIAIHSAKDLPKKLPPGLVVIAFTASPDNTDAFVGKVSLKDLKAGAKVGTSSHLRRAAVLEINPAVKVIDIRGTIGERLKLLEEGRCAGIIVATVALKRLGLGRLITETMPWETTPLQGQLAVVGRAADLNWRNIFSAIDVRRHYGTVYLVGAGPGDPDLITVKGTKLLRAADCVFYDYLVDKRLLDYAPGAEQVYVGKRKGAHALDQQALNKMLKAQAMAGKTVVRLKGGDPLIFGRGAEEIEFLSAYHIPVKVITGVSSATAIPSGLGIPLTARGVSSSVAFLSGHGEDETTSAKPVKIPDVDTAVFLMGLTKLDSIVASLKKAGWPGKTPVIIISKGTRPDQRILRGTITNIEKKLKDNPLEAPALIIAGKTVDFLEEESALEPQLLYTGTNPRKYEYLGHIVHWPMIEIVPMELDEDVVTRLKSRLPKYDIFLFTSRFGVKHFFDLLRRQGMSTASLGDKDIVAIGKETAAALKPFNLTPALIAQEESSEGLFNAMKKKYSLKGKKVLFPRSALPNPYLEAELTKEGAGVEVFPIYNNIKPETRPLPTTKVDGVIFTSPSTVKNFLKDYGTIPGSWKILCRGHLTYQSIKNLGLESEILIES